MPQNARRAKFFELSSDMLCIAGLDGYFKELNSAWPRTLGYSAAELLAKPYLEFVHPEDRRRTQDELAGLGRGQSTPGFTNRYRHKDGGYRWLRWQSALVAEERSLYAVAHDVTRLQELEDSLRAQAQEIQDLYNNAPCGYHCLDEEGMVVRMNDTELRWLGYPRAEVVGVKHITDLLPAQDAGKFQAAFAAFKEKGWIRDAEFEYRRKDGTTFPVLINANSIRDPSGKFRMTRTSVSDLTQAKLAEQKILEAVELKADFVATISHELRTPLTAIKMAIDAVLAGIMGPVNPDQKDSLAIAKSNVDRLSRLVNDVLDFRKLESGRMELHMAAQDINALVAQAVTEFEAVAREKGMTLSARPAPGLPAVTCDKDRILQVLMNLISNALKYSSRGRVTVRTGLRGGQVEVSVSDEGMGIKPEDQSKLFQSFVRIYQPGPSPRGSGLGLAISRRILEAHGGAIGMESAFGKGSTFHFTLPLKPA